MCGVEHRQRRRLIGQLPRAGKSRALVEIRPLAVRAHTPKTRHAQSQQSHAVPSTRRLISQRAHTQFNLGYSQPESCEQRPWALSQPRALFRSLRPVALTQQARSRSAFIVMSPIRSHVTAFVATISALVVVGYLALHRVPVLNLAWNPNGLVQVDFYGEVRGRMRQPACEK